MITLGDAVLYLRSKDAGLNKGLTDAEKKTKSTFDNLQKQYKNAMQVLGTVGIATGAIAAVGYAIKKVTDETMNYALEVGDLSIKIGTSTEEASRWIQIADDMRISTQQLGVGFRNLQQKGIQPTIENIANLADEYKSLRNPVQQAQFAMDKFGARAGPELQRLLEKGRAGVLDMSAAIADGLVLSQAQYDAAQRMWDKQDALNDKWLETKVILGNKLIPTLTDFTDILLTTVETVEQSAFTWHFLPDLFRNIAQAGADARREVKGLGEGAEGTGEEVDGLTVALESLQPYLDNTITIDSYGLSEAEKGAKRLLGYLRELANRRWGVMVDGTYVGPDVSGGGGPPTIPSSGAPRLMGNTQADRDRYNAQYKAWVNQQGQHGLDMIVPPGYPDDSYRVGATSGEQVVVRTKEQQKGGGGDTYNYYLTANYGFQSERSLRDDVRVLELLHG